jgi:hypothetical protein
LSFLEHDALVVAGDSNVDGSVPDDPKDEMFLACALDVTVPKLVKDTMVNSIDGKTGA